MHTCTSKHQHTLDDVSNWKRFTEAYWLCLHVEITVAFFEAMGFFLTHTSRYRDTNTHTPMHTRTHLDKRTCAYANMHMQRPTHTLWCFHMDAFHRSLLMVFPCGNNIGLFFRQWAVFWHTHPCTHIHIWTNPHVHMHMQRPTHTLWCFHLETFHRSLLIVFPSLYI